MWKKATFSLLTTIAFFAVTEAVLTLLNVQPTLAHRDPYVGYQPSIPLYVEQTGDDGLVMLATANNKLSYFNSQQFPQRKPNNTIRVFCVGGSTTFGRPYDDATSFPGWLRELLPAVDETRNWEVVNAGGISYASYRIATVMEELSDYEPDLFIVYAGHNEFLEERTYRNVRTMPAAVRQLTAVLSRTRTYSVIQSLPRDASDDLRHLLPSEVDTALDHTVGPSSYHRDDLLRGRILEHFEFNLSRMVDIARAAGAEILFVVPAANLKDCTPFKSEPTHGLEDVQSRQWSRLFSEGELLQAAGRQTEALKVYEQAASIDGRFAELHYRRGHILAGQERSSEARAAFERAIDEDVCPLRAVPGIQTIIERTAIAQAVPLVDFKAILRSDCLHNYGHESPGREYFLDHVHPTVATNRLLALGIIEVLVQTQLATAGTSWNDDAIAVASRRVASRIDPERQADALRNLAQVLSWAGKQDEAGPLAIQAVRLRAREALPDDADSLFYAAVYLAQTGSSERAISYLRKVVEIEPENGEAHWRLAVLLHEQSDGNDDEAIVHLAAAIRVDPSNADLLHMLGALLAKSGKPEEALLSYRQANEQKPDDPYIHYNIAVTLEQLGRDQLAIDWYQRAIRLDAGATKAHQNLERLLNKHTRDSEAMEYAEDARRSDADVE